MTNYKRMLHAAKERKEYVKTRMDKAYNEDDMPKFKKWDNQRIRLNDFIAYCKGAIRFKWNSGVYSR